MYMLCNSFILSVICNNLLLHQEVTLPHRVVCVKKKLSNWLFLYFSNFLFLPAFVSDLSFLVSYFPVLIFVC